jgi:uncharacterized protein
MRVLDDWMLTAERVAVHLPSATAIVADPHLGYAEARRRTGEAVPDDSMDEQLSDLSRVLCRYAVLRLVVAGDLLEDGRCRGAMTAFQEWINRQGVELALVPGNHDAGLVDYNDNFDPQLTYSEGFPLGGWQVVHGDGPLPAGPVVHGHEHPCLRWIPKTRAIRPRFFGSRIAPSAVEGACYLVGPQRLILPAFSREAAGVNVLAGRRWRPYRCFVIAGDRLLDVGELATLRSRLSAVPRSGEPDNKRERMTDQ